MFSYSAPLYREECACTYMQTNCFCINGFSPNCLKYCFSKMKASSRGRYRASYMGVYRLVTLCIQVFSIPV